MSASPKASTHRGRISMRAGSIGASPGAVGGAKAGETELRRELAARQSVDVFYFEDLLRVALQYRLDHGECDVSQSAHLIGKQAAQNRVQPAHRGVEPRNVLLAGRRLHEAGAKIVSTAAARASECILGSPLHT